MRLIFLIALALAPFHAFSYDCTSFWVNGFPDADFRRVPNPCEEFTPSSPVDPRIKVYFTAGIDVTPEVKDRMEILSNALEYTYGKYLALGEMPPIKAVFYHRPHYLDAGASGFSFINFYREGEACPVFFYPISNALSKPHFEQLVAHELFHCFQRENVKQQVDVVLLPDHEGNWWFEGMAQMFSNIVYPSNDFEYHRSFAPLNPDALLWEQDSAYQLKHFFQSYYNNMGRSERSLIELMRRMPITELHDEALTAVRIPEIAEKFHLYAEELTAGTLRDSSGALAPLRATPTVHELTTALRQEVRMSYMDFTVKPHQLIFKAGYRYRLSLGLLAPAKVSMKKAEETEYRTLLSEVVTTCDDDRKYDFVVTSIDPGLSMNVATLTVESEVLEDCACDISKPPKDECIFGTWELENSSAAAFMERMMRGAGRVLGTTGSYRATFTREGEVVWKTENFSTKIEMQGARGTMESLMNGGSSSRYSTGQQRICAHGVWSNVQFETIITVAGRTMRQRSAPPVDMGGGNFTYACEGDTLYYKSALGKGPGGSDVQMDYVFRRVP